MDIIFRKVIKAFLDDIFSKTAAMNLAMAITRKCPKLRGVVYKDKAISIIIDETYGVGWVVAIYAKRKRAEASPKRQRGLGYLLYFVSHAWEEATIESWDDMAEEMRQQKIESDEVVKAHKNSLADIHFIGPVYPFPFDVGFAGKRYITR